MTGFGRAEVANDQLVARIEITSVNRKQADIVCQLPRGLAELEASLRKKVLEKISRGRVNIAVNLERSSTTENSFQIDAARAKALEQAFLELSNVTGRMIAPVAEDFLRAPGILTFEEPTWDIPAVRELLEEALDQALLKLGEMREAEGRDLKTDLLMRLAVIESLGQEVQARNPEVTERQRESLHSRLRDLGLEIDLKDERLVKEIAIFAERCDISEEMTRLNSHIGRFREYLESAEPVGRSLDFLCQEINRELNTTGSKANDSTIAQSIVTAKTELEKIREQVQNIE